MLAGAPKECYSELARSVLQHHDLSGGSEGSDNSIGNGDSRMGGGGSDCARGHGGNGGNGGSTGSDSGGEGTSSSHRCRLTTSVGRTGGIGRGGISRHGGIGLRECEDAAPGHHRIAASVGHMEGDSSGSTSSRGVDGAPDLHRLASSLSRVEGTLTALRAARMASLEGMHSAISGLVLARATRRGLHDSRLNSVRGSVPAGKQTAAQGSLSSSEHGIS